VAATLGGRIIEVQTAVRFAAAYFDGRAESQDASDALGSRMRRVKAARNRSADRQRLYLRFVQSAYHYGATLCAVPSRYS